MRRIRAIALTAVASFVCHPANQALAAQAVSVVAVMPIVPRGKIAKAVITRTQTVVHQVLATNLGVSVTSAARLRAAAKSDPKVALRRCGGNLACFARLGKSANADEVLLVQMDVAGKEFEVVFVAISVATGAMRGHVTGRFPRGSDPQTYLLGPLSSLYTPNEPAPAKAITPAPAVAESPAPKPELAQREATPAIRDEAPVAPPTAQETSPLTPLGSAWSVVAAPSHTRTWRYLAVALGAGSLAAVSLGGYYGHTSQSTRDKIKRDGSIGQITAIDNNNEANRAASRANLFFMVSGGLAGVAAISFAFDFAGGD